MSAVDLLTAMEFKDHKADKKKILFKKTKTRNKYYQPHIAQHQQQYKTCKTAKFGRQAAKFIDGTKYSHSRANVGKRQITIW